MFRRHWSGLPQDVTFASDLKGLGYFVNDQDEIRSIENPDYYFKYFLNKNARINDRQRFGFDRAVQVIIHERLEKAGLEKITLPLGTTQSQPHVPIFASPDLQLKSRIVVVFGEPVQDVGMIAGRVANGPGGINKGSMVSVVQALQAQSASDTDSSAPGIVLANTGQLYWWPDEKRALTVTESETIPLPSLVHAGRRYIPAVNDIPGNEDSAAHVAYVLREVLQRVMREDTKLDVIAIGQSCETVERFMDVEQNWKIWEGRLNAMLLLGSVYSTEDLANHSFKEFLANRTRGYINSPEPLDTPLAPPDGNPSEAIVPLGCPSFSSAEPYYTETIIISALSPALAYLEDLAATPGYENPPVIVVERPEAEPAEASWDDVPEAHKPLIMVPDNSEISQEAKRLRRWERFEETGQAPESDSDDPEDL